MVAVVLGFARSLTNFVRNTPEGRASHGAGCARVVCPTGGRAAFPKKENRNGTKRKPVLHDWMPYIPRIQKNDCETMKIMPKRFLMV